MADNSKVSNFDEFKEHVFRLSNIGFYVRWVASQYNDGCKGLYLVDLTSRADNEEIIQTLVQKGFEFIRKDKFSDNFTLYQFKSPKLHEPTGV